MNQKALVTDYIQIDYSREKINYTVYSLDELLLFQKTECASAAEVTRPQVPAGAK